MMLINVSYLYYISQRNVSKAKCLSLKLHQFLVLFGIKMTHAITEAQATRVCAETQAAMVHVMGLWISLSFKCGYPLWFLKGRRKFKASNIISI